MQQNPDGTNYTGATLTLDDIDADLTVHAEFELAGSLLAVTCSAVDTDGNPAAEGLVTLTAEGLDENGKAQRGSTVTLTASSLQPGTGIQRWEVSTDGGANWETKAGSTMAYTIYSLQDNTQVRVVLQTSTASYTVNYSIEGMLSSDSSAGTLTAKTGDTVISSGASCVAYSSLVFTYTEPGDYEFVGWEVTGTTGTETADGTTHTCAISSLDANTTVKAVVQKKPLINVSDPANGTLTVKVSGTDTSIANGTYVYSGTQVTVTAAPDANYVVDTIKAGSTAIFNGDKTNGEKYNGEPYAVSADTAFTATLKEKPTVTIGSVSNGTVAVTGTLNGSSKTLTSGDHVDFGSTIKVTATPDSGHVVDDITVTGVENGNLLTDYRANGEKSVTSSVFTTNGAKQVTVTFLAKPKVTIESDLTGGSVSVTGTVDGAAGTTVENNDYVDFGSTIRVTATPDRGYVVKSIQSNSTEILTGNKTNGAKIQTVAVGTTDALTTYAVTGEFLEKPVVTITNSPANGAVEVRGTKDDTSDQTITTGSYVDFDTDLTVTLTPGKGFEAGSCKANGTVLSGTTPAGNPDGKTYTISGVQTGQTIETVWLAIPEHALTLSAETIDAGGAHGTISANVTRKGLSDYTQANVTGSGTFYRDSDLEIVAVPDAGYRVQSYTWTINGVSGSGENLPVLTNVQGDVSITARFVTMNAGVTFGPTDENNVGGYISSAMGGNTDYLGYAASGVSLGENATLTLGATVQPGYEVEGWYKTVGGGTAELITGTEGETSYTYTSDGATSAIYFSVRFRQVEYDVTCAASPAAGGSVSAGITGDKARGGQTVTFTASPNPGYVVTGWTVNGEDVTDSDGNPNTLAWTVPNGYLSDPAVTGYEIRALFDLDTYTLSYSQPGNGSLTATVADSATVKGNTVVTFTAAPDTHYEVDSWMVNGVTQTETGNTLNVTVTADTTVAVTFRLKQYTVTLTQPAEGGAATATQTGPVTANTDVTFTADPATGYELKEWLVNGVSTAATAENTLALTVTGTTTVQPVFKKIDITINYTLTGTEGAITATANGSTVTSGGTIPYGSGVTLTVTPTVSTDMVLRWTVNGTAVAEMTAAADAPMEYTIENVTAAQTVQVELVTRPTYTVTAAAEGGGTVAITGDTEGAGSVTVSRNGSVTITATENSYYQFKEWQLTVGGTTTTRTGRTLTLSDIKADTTVKAVFFEAGLFKVMFEDVTAYGGATPSTVAITANGTAIHPGPDEGSSVPVVGGSELVFTAAPATGYMVKAWKVNGVVQENLSNTLIIDSLTGNTKVTMEFETPATMHTIPGSGTGYTISNISKTPSDYGTASQIRNRGTVTFTVTPESSMYLTKLEINGTDCLTSTGTDSEPNKLTIRNNGDGSFTITVANVTQTISLTAESMQFKTEKKQLDTVPAELTGKFDTVDALQTALRTAVTQVDSKVPAGQTALFDIKLQYTINGTDWIDATPAQFPAGGITVTIPYSDLGSGVNSTYDFTVIHMFTTGMNGHRVGDTESITPTKNADSISFTVTSLSPFAIGWSKYTAPAGGGGGGGGGGGAAPAETVTIRDSANGKVTADNVCAAKGDTVTLTVTPDAGYALEKLTVTGKDGQALKLTDLGGGKYTFVMADASATVEALFAAEKRPCDGGVTCPVYHYSDVDTGLWYHEALDYAVVNGIMNGIGNDKFDPNGDLQRCMLMTMLARMDGVDTAGGQTWYEKGMAWAVANGISDGTNPGASITREQIAAMLYRYAGLKDYDTDDRGDLSVFVDGSETSAWALEPMRWAVGCGLLQGKDGKRLDPTGTATRAEVAQMIMNFCLLVKTAE